MRPVAHDATLQRPRRSHHRENTDRQATLAGPGPPSQYWQRPPTAATLSLQAGLREQINQLSQSGG
jgi:hypothetical protein